MMAMFFAQRVILGKCTFAQVPEKLKKQVAEVLLEEPVNGHWTGYTPEYIAVTLPEGYNGRQGEFVRVRLTGLNESGMDGTPCE